MLAGVAASRGASGTHSAAAAPAATSAASGAAAGPPADKDLRQNDGSDLPALRAPAGALSEADGVLSDGVTVFDDQVPAVAHLNPALLGALRRAATDAASKDHVEFQVNSGWRSVAYQEQLLRDAVAKYGSVKRAARWVATPQTSAHVSGNAVDIGPPKAAKWLFAHGSAYGLCQIYRNETWHYELRPESVAHGCPAMYVDPTRDPRMQQ